MDISVIIVSYNVSSFLDQALTTLKDSARGIEYEVFVVDNASQDGSPQLVREKHPWVKLIVNKENAGFAKANNQALREAKGRYILLLNPDTVLRPDTLKTMIHFLDEHREAGIAGCKVLNPDGTLQLACRRGFPTPGVAFFKMAGLSTLFPRSKMFGAYNLTYLDSDTLAEVDAVSGSFMMIRREVLERVGMLDEKYFMYGEDIDFCYRVKQAGWKIYYVPYTEIIHFKGESTKTVSSFTSARHFYKAMLIFVEKHYTGNKRKYPIWFLNTGIYIKMVYVYSLNALNRFKAPLVDLLLLNISLILGIVLRFGISLENVPAYTSLQWISIFITYSTFYMATFYSLGLYHRHRNSPERALVGVFFGFLLNVLIVYFIKQYNFSRIASFYCWGFNTLLISGLRFFPELFLSRDLRRIGRKTLIIGTLKDAVRLRYALQVTGMDKYDIIGCLEISENAIRGSEMDNLHVLGLIRDLSDVVREYSVDVCIMTGPNIPFSRILTNGTGLGSLRPEFKFVPELKTIEEVQKTGYVTVIDIHSSRTFGIKQN